MKSLIYRILVWWIVDALYRMGSTYNEIVYRHIALNDLFDPYYPHENPFWPEQPPLTESSVCGKVRG